jgi:DNA-binding NarL/FixJ family response regulator
MRQVLLVCNPLMRSGLREAWRGAAPDLEISEATKFSEARIKLRKDPGIAWMTLDTAVPDFDGAVSVESLSRDFPLLRIILILTQSESVSIDEAISSGAVGMIPGCSSVGDVELALRESVTEGGKTPTASREHGQGNVIATLSPAQLRVLRGIQRGLRNKEIAFEMNLTEKTVKAYMTVLYRKLGVGSRTQALIRANELLR